MLARLVDGWLRAPRWLRGCVPVIGVAVLWWSSSQVPGDEPRSTARSLFHNSMHVVAYGCLAASIWLWWSRRPAHEPQPRRSWGAFALASAYGVVDEVHQSFVPGRDCSLFDVVSDAAGAALAVVLLRAIVGRSRGSRRAVLVLVAAALGGVLAATFVA
ncbi:MAG: VanZ family protein [Planctomycetes bacterium]|nr:VanZ family protein [Planctomycetota bacterium]